MLEDFVDVNGGSLCFLLADNLLESVEVIVLEHVGVAELGVAEGATMVSVDSLEYAFLAVDVATAGDVAVLDLVEADVAEELFLQLLQRHFEILIVHVVDVHDQY